MHATSSILSARKVPAANVEHEQDDRLTDEPQHPYELREKEGPDRGEVWTVRKHRTALDCHWVGSCAATLMMHEFDEPFGRRSD
jgi:hypothetical protein